MVVKCVAERLKPEKLPEFVPAKERRRLAEVPHAVEQGREYLVYGLALHGGLGHVVIDTGLNLLTLVPLALFEIIDSRASRYWTVSVYDQQGIFIAPPPFHRLHFLEDFADGEPRATRDVQQFRTMMQDETKSAAGHR